MYEKKLVKSNDTAKEAIQALTQRKDQEISKVKERNLSEVEKLRQEVESLQLKNERLKNANLHTVERHKKQMLKQNKRLTNEKKQAVKAKDIALRTEYKSKKF